MTEAEGAVKVRSFPKADQRLLARFMSKVRRSAGCWRWKGRWQNGQGYGKLCAHGSPIYAHRLAWKLFVGPIPKGLCVLHRCDNPSCVRPSHLFLGTQAENMQDCSAKGRINRYVPPERVPRGEKHWNAKLSAEQVSLIRVADGTHAAIAARFGVSRMTVSDIRNRRTWA